MSRRITVQPADADPLARRRLLRDGEREGLIIAKTTDLYLAYLHDGTLIGMTGFLWRRKSVIFKNHYIVPEHRGNGYARELMDWRIEQARARGHTFAEGAATPAGLREYVRRGAEIVKHHKNGTTHVRLDLRP